MRGRTVWRTFLKKAGRKILPASTIHLSGSIFFLPSAVLPRLRTHRRESIDRGLRRSKTVRIRLNIHYLGLWVSRMVLSIGLPNKRYSWLLIVRGPINIRDDETSISQEDVGWFNFRVAVAAAALLLSTSIWLCPLFFSCLLSVLGPDALPASCQGRKIFLPTVRQKGGEAQALPSFDLEYPGVPETVNTLNGKFFSFLK